MGIVDKLQAQIAVFQDFRDNRSAYLADILSDRQNELLGRQKDQLASGQDSYGNDLIPLYTQDLKPGGYFKTRESATRYMHKKLSIKVPVNYVQLPRNDDAPNLYWNGKFHSEITVDISSEIIDFTGATSYANNIIDKYGHDKFGLNETFWRMVMENGVIDEMIRKIRNGLEPI